MRDSHRVTAARIDPTEPMGDPVTFIHVITKLCVILLNIQRKQGRVDGRISVDSLHGRSKDRHSDQFTNWT